MSATEIYMNDNSRNLFSLTEAGRFSSSYIGSNSCLSVSSSIGSKRASTQFLIFNLSDDMLLRVTGCF